MLAHGVPGLPLPARPLGVRTVQLAQSKATQRLEVADFCADPNGPWTQVLHLESQGERTMLNLLQHQYQLRDILFLSPYEIGLLVNLTRTHWMQGSMI
jgi:hypothetical protein